MPEYKSYEQVKLEDHAAAGHRTPEEQRRYEADYARDVEEAQAGRLSR
jgi:hypothetical protein